MGHLSKSYANFYFCLWRAKKVCVIKHANSHASSATLVCLPWGFINLLCQKTLYVPDALNNCVWLFQRWSSCLLDVLWFGLINACFFFHSPSFCMVHLTVSIPLPLSVCSLGCPYKVAKWNFYWLGLIIKQFPGWFCLVLCGSILRKRTLLVFGFFFPLFHRLLLGILLIQRLGFN